MFSALLLFGGTLSDRIGARTRRNSGQAKKNELNGAISLPLRKMVRARASGCDPGPHRPDPNQRNAYQYEGNPTAASRSLASAARWVATA
nr:hypothetical protein [Parafrankia sp. BMG5.11]